MEENKQKRSKGEKARLLLQHLKPAATVFGIGIGASLVATLARTAFTQIIRFTVDGVLLGEMQGFPAKIAALAPNVLLIAAFVMAVLVALLEFGAGYLQDSNLPKGSERFVKSLRDALYRHIQRLPFSWHAKNPTGDMIQRCTSDVEVVRAFVAEQMVELITTGFLIIVYMGMMFAMNVKLSMVVFLFIPIIVAYSFVFFKRISKGYAAADEAEGELSTCVQENLTGVRVVRAFGREKDELEKFRKKNNHYTNTWLKVGDLLTVFWSLGDILSMTQILLVIVLGVRMCVGGTLTLGTYLAFVSYTRQLNWPVRALGRIISEMSKAGVSMDRLLYILNAQEEDVPAEPEKADMAGEIRFEHVSFSYEEKEVLHDVSFSVPGGSTLGIIGGTGSGKSTIALLLARLYDPDAGRITIGGVDIKQMEPHELRRNIGMVLQEPFLFSRTVAENIAITRPQLTMDEVERASREACLHEAVTDFKDGYDTVVGERGVTLSGGQKQRTAIARALLSKAPILVFDDALSAVDAKTDAAIRSQLRSAAGKSTLVLIAHRVSTLEQADRIIVLENGRIAEQGTHDELIAKQGIYAKTAAMQSANGEGGEGDA